MATIKDIAKLAGVSHGTASNVLNQRGNVSSEKISKVLKAAKELGYTINPQAQLLRKGFSNKVVVFIPFVLKEHYSVFYESILQQAEKESIEIEVFYFKEKNLRSIVEKESLLKPSVAVFVGYVPKDNVLRIFQQDTKIHFVDVLEDPNKYGVISFDYSLLAKELIKRLNKGNQKLLLIDYKFENGKSLSEDILNEISEHISIERFSMENRQDLIRLFEQYERLDEFSAIFAIDREILRNIQEIQSWLGRSRIDNIFALDSFQLIRAKKNIFELDYKLCAKKVIDLIKTGDMGPILMTPEGFRAKNDYTKYANPQKIRLLTISSPTTRVLKFLSGIFGHETNIRIEIEELESSEYDVTKIKNSAFTKGYDLIRLDMAVLPEVAENLFVPLEDVEGSKKLLKQFDEKLLNEFMYSNKKWYGVPLDVSVQLLYYRKDLFLNKLVQREFYERFRKELIVPQSYEEFDLICQFFTKNINKASQTEYGHSIAMKTPLVASCDFLPRYREQMLNQVANPYQTALEQYKASIRTSDQNKEKWWGDIVQEFAEGKTAMMTVFSNYSTVLAGQLQNDIDFGVARIPGKQPLIGGGTVGILKESNMKEQALLFLEWLYSDEISKLIVALGGMILSKEVLNNQELMEMHPWLSHLEKSIQLGKRQVWNNQKFSLSYEIELGERVLQEVFND